MKGKSLLAACVIVLLAVASIGLHLLANNARLQADRYGFMYVHDGQLVVQFGQRLVWLDAHGEEVHQFDLKPLGIRAVGDFALFDNGDLLLYHRPEEPGLGHDLMSWLRLQERNPPALQGKAGLYRCSAYGCAPFGRELPAFDGAFRLLIEPDTQRVQVAHTRAFRLYLLDDSGQLLAKSSDSELRFPNQLLLRGDELWLADTNRQRLVRLQHTPEDYGRIIQSLRVMPDKKHRWPHQFAWDGQAWWVNVGDHNLSNGRVLRLDTEGNHLSEIPRAQLQNPLAMAWFADSLWLADDDSPRLLRFDQTAGALPGAQSATLARLEARSHAAIEHWQLLGRLGLGGFVLVLLGGFYAAWRLEREQTREVLQDMNQRRIRVLIEQPAAALAPGQTLWLDNRLLRLRPWILLLLLALGLWLAVLLGRLLLANDSNATLKLFMSLMTFSGLGLLATNAWLVHRLSRQRLGVTEQHFLLEQDLHHSAVVSAGQLSYNASHLATEQACIALGNNLFWFFDRRQLHQHLFPRLKQARAEGAWAMQRALWRSRHPQLVASLWMLLSLLPPLVLATLL
ncbi:MAG: hypothetical protein E6Q72_05175 [Pseudomonas sp.]|nr:MAG: hypothetical protein E6Q72_05175 [Pseudomonas sp.]